MPKTLTPTPWGWTREVEELAEGVWRVTTAGHGGLKPSRERWEELTTAWTQCSPHCSPRRTARSPSLGISWT